MNRKGVGVREKVKEEWKCSGSYPTQDKTASFMKSTK